jgi:hypothetical protein
MPSRKKKPTIVRTAIFRISPLVLGVLLICSILGFIGYFYESQAMGEAQADETYRHMLMDSKVSLLYGQAKAAAAGVKQEPNQLSMYYDHNLTPGLAAKLKQEGPTALFCSDKAPDNMTFHPLGQADSFLVDEEFYNGPGAESTYKQVAVGFTWPDGRISKVTCK